MNTMPHQKTKPLYMLSPSSLNLLQDCPRCFWLSMVKKQKRPSGAFPSLPSGVDHLLKMHFDRHRAKGELPPELNHHRVEARLFADMELLKLWRNNFKGIQYIDEKSGILLRGAVDDLLEHGSKLIVLDYKTRGFPVKDDTSAHYQDQLNIYNFLLRKNGYKTEDFAYLLFFIPESISETGHFVFHTELVKMAINIRHAEELFHRAIDILQNGIPDVSEKCGFCKWANNE